MLDSSHAGNGPVSGCATATRHGRSAGRLQRVAIRTRLLIGATALGLAGFYCALPVANTVSAPESVPQAVQAPDAVVDVSQPAAPITQVSLNVAARRTQAKASASSEPDFSPQLVGCWTDNYQGKRYMRLRADGTGTMTVEPAGLGATLFAPLLTFNMQWSYANNILSLRTLGGEPDGKVKLILKVYGDRAQYLVSEAGDEWLRLLDKSSDKQYDWRRVSTSGDEPAADAATDARRR